MYVQGLPAGPLTYLLDHSHKAIEAKQSSTWLPFYATITNSHENSHVTFAFSGSDDCLPSVLSFWSSSPCQETINYHIMTLFLEEHI